MLSIATGVAYAEETLNPFGIYNRAISDSYDNNFTINCDTYTYVYNLRTYYNKNLVGFRNAKTYLKRNELNQTYYCIAVYLEDSGCNQ